jgi:hypothetical protein
VATIRGNDRGFGRVNETSVCEIDGKDTGFMCGGTHEFVPGRHTLTFFVDRRASTSGTISSYASSDPIGGFVSIFSGIPRGRFLRCSFELDAEPGHDYLVSGDIANLETDKHGYVTALAFTVTSTMVDGQSSTELVPAKCH